eukprot:7389486-Prymnesium_polylepis.1
MVAGMWPFAEYAIVSSSPARTWHFVCSTGIQYNGDRMPSLGGIHTILEFGVRQSLAIAPRICIGYSVARLPSIASVRAEP